MYQNIVKNYIKNLSLNNKNRYIVGKNNRIKFIKKFLISTRYKHDTDLLRDLQNRKSY